MTAASPADGRQPEQQAKRAVFAPQRSALPASGEAEPKERKWPSENFTDLRSAHGGQALHGEDHDLLHELQRLFRPAASGSLLCSARLSVICVHLDAGDVISALSGKLGMLPGVTAKTMTSKAQLRPDAP